MAENAGATSDHFAVVNPELFTVDKGNSKERMGSLKDVVKKIARLQDVDMAGDSDSESSTVTDDSTSSELGLMLQKKVDLQNGMIGDFEMDQDGEVDDMDEDDREVLDMFTPEYASDSITFEEDRRLQKRRRRLYAEDGRQVYHVCLNDDCQGPSQCKFILMQMGCDQSAFMRISRKNRNVFYVLLYKRQAAALKGHDEVGEVYDAFEVL